MVYLTKFIQQYNLNIDMLKISDDVDVKTNQIINKTLNYYSSKIKNNNIVIFHQQDDTISMICYTLLKILQNQIHFTLYLYGKHKNTKDMYHEDKKKFICKWKAKKLLKLENTILITPYNPIYKVIEEEKIFNYFNSNNTINLIEKFNYPELITAQIFYHISYIKNDLLQYKNLERDNKTLYKALIDTPYLNCNNYEILSWVDKRYKGKNIYCLWLTGDFKKDNELINLVEKTNDLIFYFYDKNNKRPEILDSGFEYWLNKSINTPVEDININIEFDLSNIVNQGYIYILGDMPKDIINAICKKNNFIKVEQEEYKYLTI